MAKSIKDWYDIMIAEKNTFANLNVYQPNIDSSQTLLSDLKSTSKVARWRLMLWVVATCAFAVEVLLDVAILTMQAIAAKSRYGTLPWYAAVAKEFQYGDALSQVNLEYVYPVIDPTKQIVAVAAANEGNGKVNIKIARLNGGVLAPLTTPQLSAFTSYINLKKAAGSTVQVINNNPDELRLYLAVNFDPLVLSPTGELISTPGTYPVEDAVELYLSSLPFDGKFELMKLIDKIQEYGADKGVVSAYVTNATSRYGTNPFISFAQSYYPNAGYMIIEAATPLSSTITYTANV